MAYLKLHGAPIMQELDAEEVAASNLTPDARLQALTHHTISSILGNDILNGPPCPDSINLIGIEHQFACLLEEVSGQDGDMSWVPTMIDAVRLGHDEPIREVVTFGFCDRAEMVIFAWNSTGDGFSVMLKGLGHPGVAGINVHRHMPKASSHPHVIALAESVGHHLWGPAWALAVPEEDRC